MSTTVTAPERTAAEQTVVVQDPPRSNTIGMIALGLAILGFLLAIFLMTAGLAWMLLLPAIGLAIAGLIIPNRRRGVAVAALIIGVIGLILSFVGIRLPAGSLPDQEVIFNNDGVNPFSVLVGPLPGQELGVGGVTTEASGTDSGLTVTVDSVDCHQPLASVTGLNITGEVCAITLAVSNNGTDVVTIDSSNITATADGTLLSADVGLGEGAPIQAQINPGGSANGVVYVNIPDGATGLDGLTVSLDDDTVVNVDLGGLGG